MGNILAKKGKLDAAIGSYKQAIKIKPDYAVAYSNMGNALTANGDLDPAIERHKQAIKINSDFADAFSNLGNALRAKGEIDAAINNFKQSIKIKPDFAMAYYNMALIMMEEAEFNLALNYIESAIRIQPDLHKATFLKSRLLLVRQEFNLGWSLYAKHFYSQLELQHSFFKRVRGWDGSSLRGKNILVHATQGVGDEIYFSSCIPDLIELFPKQIYLECDLRLKPLFERSFPEVIVCGGRSLGLTKTLHAGDNPMIESDLDYSIPIHCIP